LLIEPLEPHPSTLNTSGTNTGRHFDRTNTSIENKMAALPSDVQKVANEGVVKLFGKWDAQE
jgi:hypothetical protein